jgi:hypothetical protein
MKLGMLDPRDVKATFRDRDVTFRCVNGKTDILDAKTGEVLAANAPASTLLRCAFYGIKEAGNESESDKLKRLLDGAIKEHPLGRLLAKDGDGSINQGPGPAGQPAPSVSNQSSENELNPDRIRAILEAQGITGAMLDEIMGLIGADFASGANLSGGSNIGAPVQAGYSEHMAHEKSAYKH